MPSATPAKTAQSNGRLLIALGPTGDVLAESCLHHARRGPGGVPPGFNLLTSKDAEVQRIPSALTAVLNVRHAEPLAPEPLLRTQPAIWFLGSAAEVVGQLDHLGDL